MFEFVLVMAGIGIFGLMLVYAVLCGKGVRRP